MERYSRKQLWTLAVFCFCQFCTALCFSIQAPFYPAEAESKGASPSEYGFVFGVYELTIFLTSPLYGKYLNSIGTKLVNNCGILTVAVASILFGFLDKMNGKDIFIGFSFAIRIVEANGAAAFVTAAFTILAKEFPNNVGSAFATVETFFGLGLIVGPTLGGALFALGGFICPFVTVGVLLLLASILVFCLLPVEDSYADTSKVSTTMLLSVMKIPCVLLSIVTVISASISIGFLQSTLEPHLRPLDLSPFQLGLVFVINGAAYAISAPVWGRLCDNYISPRTVCLCGCLLVAIAFLLIGPLPFLPLNTTLPLIILSLIIHGLGFGAELVATFSGLNTDIIKRGFLSNDTHGLVSGMWNSSFALGCFIGPSIAGILYDAYGFKYATILVFGLHAILFVLTMAFMCFERDERDAHTEEEVKPIVSHEDLVSLGSSTSSAVPIHRPSARIVSYGSMSSFKDFHFQTL